VNRQIILNQDLLGNQSESAKEQLQRYAHCAQLLSALADPLRLQIVSLLMDGPAHVSEIAENVDGDFSRVSHHLKILKRAGLVLVERQAKLQVHSLKPGFAIPAKGKSPDRLDLGCCAIAIPKRA
jgi:ArsR family transcriptional regulator, nickel/cobalt-responsive transcriptional repressor